ncbi:hypothetical protein ACIBEJ_34900 [Nonomuraea sp. NPDC050790]|uniref:hypothetical protein n=1 Tax=Nonomuraea sp. NPDC050790 TaxID=3364371 RepID=UPI00378D285E
MSSTYRIPCISHDPALVAGEYDTPDAAERAIRDGIDDHPQCDLLIGRYSYPLIEVGCPPTTGPDRSGRHPCLPHSATEWVDVAWLRILATVHHSGDDQMQALARDSHLAHWPLERLRRLRDQLSLDLAEQT